MIKDNTIFRVINLKYELIIFLE
ncbi:hypothetical protein BN1321_80099 [Staphylococcus aureus]|uniref:Uncharacterized protein n=1 Tax=Staphylococcus aureus TaxID=1280 RepID=A0A0U1MWT7_STAAU|nr:hypothetical protein BN1321_80099 [Staphylococcus aureus]